MCGQATHNVDCSHRRRVVVVVVVVELSNRMVALTSLVWSSEAAKLEFSSSARVRLHLESALRCFKKSKDLERSLRQGDVAARERERERERESDAYTKTLHMVIYQGSLSI